MAGTYSPALTDETSVSGIYAVLSILLELLCLFDLVSHECSIVRISSRVFAPGTVSSYAIRNASSRAEIVALGRDLRRLVETGVLRIAQVFFAFVFISVLR